MATLEYNYSGDEVPASLTLLTLQRADTGASVTLPSPATFAENPAGTFTISFDEPTPGLTYLYTYRRTWDDGTYDPPEADSVEGTTGSYAGRYTTREAVRTWLGTINADLLADLDNDGAADAGAWEQAVVWGEDELDHYASGGDWADPLAFTGGTADQQDYAARVVQRWATVLAGHALYAKRPAAKETTATLDEMRAAVIRQIIRAKNGYRPLPGIAAAADTPGPQSIAPTRDARGLPVDTTATPAPWARPYGWWGGWGW